MSEYRRGRIPGYQGYWADTDGNIWCSLPRCGVGAEVEPRLKKPTPRKTNGVLEVCISIQGKRLYRRVGYLILLTFIGERPEELEVCHKDDKQTNNRLDNLYYGTKRQNMEDKRRNGRIFAGETHHFAKLTAEQVKEIRESEDVADILANRYNVHSSTIYRIRQGRNWTTEYSKK